MQVIFGDDFGKKFKNFPKADKQKIFDFVRHVEQFGFEGLAGRNKSSDDVSKDDPEFSIKVEYVKKHNLWHYHIGIPNYVMSSTGEQVSEYLLHYVKGDDFIRLVEMSYHPPFQLPTEEKLN